MNQAIDRLTKGIEDLLNEQRELFAELPKSIRMAQIWPDAFKDGLRCSSRLNGIENRRSLKSKYPHPYEKLGTITRAYLKRQDGVEHDITEEEFFSIITAGR